MGAGSHPLAPPTLCPQSTWQAARGLTHAPPKAGEPQYPSMPAWSLIALSPTSPDQVWFNGYEAKARALGESHLTLQSNLLLNSPQKRSLRGRAEERRGAAALKSPAAKASQQYSSKGRPQVIKWLIGAEENASVWVLFFLPSLRV